MTVQHLHHALQRDVRAASHDDGVEAVVHLHVGGVVIELHHWLVDGTISFFETLVELAQKLPRRPVLRLDNHDAVDLTIAMGLLPEYLHLLTPSEPDTAASEVQREHTVHPVGRLHFCENGDAIVLKRVHTNAES